MSRSASHLPRLVCVAGFALLAACSGPSGNDLADIDEDLFANGTDPALTSALEDQILVDPELVQQAHPNTVRPPETPVQAQYPSGSTRAEAAIAGLHEAGAEASPQGARSASPCRRPVAFDHDLQWSTRLPKEFPLYPGGEVTEAAGVDADGCRVRVVTFITADPAEHVLEHYRRLAGQGGYSAEQQRRGEDFVLGGVNDRTDGAYYLIVTPSAPGAEAALIVNNGR